MLDEDLSKYHKCVKGDQLPDTMFSCREGGLKNDPNEALDEKSEIWQEERKRTDPEARRRYMAVIRRARAKVLSSGNPPSCSSVEESAKAARRINKNTSTGIGA